MSDQSETPPPEVGGEKPKLERLEGQLDPVFFPARKDGPGTGLELWPSYPKDLSGRIPDSPSQSPPSLPSLAETMRQPAAPRRVDNRSKDEILYSLRSALGGDEYRAQVEKFGEENLYQMVAALGEKVVVEGLEKLALYQEKSSPTKASPPRPAPAPLHFNKVRTRESGRRVNQFVVRVALIYGAAVAALFPDGALAAEIYNSLLPVVIGVLLLVSAVLFLRTGSFDASVIFTASVFVTIVISLVLGVIGNFGKLGVLSLEVGGLAFAGCLILGLLIGRPVFRWIERKQLEPKVWIYQLVAGLLAVGVLTAGWIGLVAVFPVSLPVP